MADGMEMSNVPECAEPVPAPSLGSEMPEVVIPGGFGGEAEELAAHHALTGT